MSEQKPALTYRCPNCGAGLNLETLSCPSCDEKLGIRRDFFDDFMLDSDVPDHLQEFYEGAGTRGDDEGGPRISAQQFKVPNILNVLPDDYDPDRWLDLGCGGGWIIEELRDRWNNDCIVGLDISAERLTEATRRNPEAHFVRAPVEAIPYPDDHFPFLSCLDVIEHVPDPEALLAEAHRVGREMVIKFPIEDTVFDKFQKKFWWPAKRWTKALARGTTPEPWFNPHLHRFSFQDARNLLEANGYEIIKEHISEHPFRDNHATMYPPAYNITDDTPWLKWLDFHLKRGLLVGAMRITYLLLPWFYYDLFNSGIYFFVRRR